MFCVPKFLTKWHADSADPDHTAPEQSDQNLQCLPFHLRKAE